MEQPSIHEKQLAKLKKKVSKLENELDDMTLALANAWDQLVPFLQESSFEIDVQKRIKTLLPSLLTASNTTYAGIFLFDNDTWYSTDNVQDFDLTFFTQLKTQPDTTINVQIDHLQWFFVQIILEGKPAGFIGIATTDESRQYTAVEVRILQRIAERLGNELAVIQLAIARQTEIAMQRDLQIAHDIQESLLPETMPTSKTVDLASYWNPAKEVGGDAWSWIELDNNKIAWFVLDVAGKGLPAALAAVPLHTAIRMGLNMGLSVSACLERVNDEFYDLFTRTDLMATCSLLMLDLKTGQLDFANAGHPPTLVRHRGKWQMIEATVPPIGVLPFMDIEPYSLILEPNDLVLLYSDGFSEIEVNNELWGYEGLIKIIPFGAKNAQQLCNYIVTMAQQIGRVDDDQTLVIASFNGAKVPEKESFSDSLRLRLEHDMKNKFQFEATLEGVSLFNQKLEEMLADVPLETRVNIVLAIQELCVNIVRHAYAGTPGTIHVEFEQSDEFFTFFVKDNAPITFEMPTSIIDVDPLSLPENGMGLFIIHQAFEVVRYTTIENGHEWYLQKQRGKE